MPTTFSDRLRAARGLTQRQVALSLGMSLANYQCYERGITQPHIDKAIQLADFFRVPLDYLVGRIDVSHYPTDKEWELLKAVINICHEAK